MSNQHSPKSNLRAPTIYEIRLKGLLSDRWSNWLEGMAITPQEGGETLLTGPVIDDAALYGLLKKVRDLGMPLISVNRVGPDQTDAVDTAQ